MSGVYLWKIEVFNGVAEIRKSTVSAKRKDYCGFVGAYFTIVRVRNFHAERRKSGNKRRKFNEEVCMLSNRPKDTCDGLALRVEDCNDRGYCILAVLRNRKVAQKVEKIQ